MQAQTVGFLALHTPRFSTQAIRKSGAKVKISIRKFLTFYITVGLTHAHSDIAWPNGSDKIPFF